MYRRRNDLLEVFLIHPGGPYFARKDLGSWSIPKGEYTEEEQAFAAAQREFGEETGFEAHGPFIELGQVKQPAGKIVTAWAFAGDCDPKALRSNSFTMEWPPRSGHQMEFPEVDQGAWYSIEIAREYLNKGQLPLLERLVHHVTLR